MCKKKKNIGPLGSVYVAIYLMLCAVSELCINNGYM